MHYPSLFLFSVNDRNTISNDTLALFLSGLNGEIQRTWFINDNVPQPYQYWKVFVNTRMLTHANIASTFNYGAKHFDFAIPSFFDLREWRRMEKEGSIKKVDNSLFAWIVSDKEYPCFRLEFVPCDEAGNYQCCDRGDCLEGITLNGEKVGDFSIESDEDSVIMTVYSKQYASMPQGIKLSEISFPANIEDLLPHLIDGSIKLSINYETGVCELKFDSGDCLQIKQTGRGVSARVWSNFIPNWEEALKAVKEAKNKADRELFMDLLVNRNYSITVNGEDAIRGCNNHEGETFTIYVQDSTGVSEYEVAKTLDCCEICGEDGAFVQIDTGNGKDWYSFRVGLKNKETGDCDPVLVRFSRI